MNSSVGLWIDHKQAYLIWYDQNKVEVIQSDVEPRLHYTGGARIEGSYNQGVDSEAHHDKRYEHELGKYYARVIQMLKKADSILIMGPGEAKLELERALEKHKGLREKLQKIETVDKMTENQMIAYVRKFYKSQVIA
jgi:stalled ribosome rescue protein Dom34